MKLETYNDMDCLQFDLPEACVTDCSHSGRCDDDVAFWLNKLDLEVNRDAAISWLRETGAWTPEEMAEETDETLASRVLWIAACNASENTQEETE